MSARPLAKRSVVPVPPTNANAHLIFIRALRSGVVEPSRHFTEQCSAREFDILDAETLLETGSIISGPIYEQEHNSFKYEIFNKIDGKGWNLVIALDCDSDFSESPRISLVTVHQCSLKRAASKKERTSK